MNSPFRGRASWVIEFLKSPEGGMTCVWFRSACLLLSIVCHQPNPQRSTACPALASSVYETKHLTRKGKL
jgi:hypothetical protein